MNKNLEPVSRFPVIYLPRITRVFTVLSFLLLIIFQTGCTGQSENQKEKTSVEEKEEMKKADEMMKSSRQKEDSVKAYWENKMKQPGAVGE